MLKTLFIMINAVVLKIEYSENSIMKMVLLLDGISVIGAQACGVK